MVAILHGPLRAADADQVTFRVEAKTLSPGGKKAEVNERLFWETTALDTLATARGFLSLSLDPETKNLRAAASLSSPPASAGTFSGRHYTCAAHDDGDSGFVVLCRLPSNLRQVSAANVTGPRVLDGVSIARGKSILVRLDLPRSPSGAEARIIGFVHGATGSVLRAEATWPDDGPGTVFVEMAERSQPLSPSFGR
jgi:hypothetical protein